MNTGVTCCCDSIHGEKMSDSQVATLPLTGREPLY